MIPFDWSVSQYFNHAIGVSRELDAIIREIAENHLIKGGVPMAMLWWLWNLRDAHVHPRRHALLGALLGAFLAIVLARGSSLLLPFHVRPMQEPSLGLHIAEGAQRDMLDGWSSLPSDNAAFFFAIAFGLWQASRRAGVIALLHAIFVVCLPRLILGVHYASDLVAGAMVGLIASWLSQRKFLNSSVYARAIHQEEVRPQWFYLVLFLLTMQMAELLVSSRELAHLAVHNLRLLLP